MKIGVFDSGIGGLSVANAIKRAMPEHEIIFKNDAEHLPYGTKTTDEILVYCLPVLESLAEDGCAVIVVACNTVSTNLIDELRQIIAVPLIATEPMVKPAAEHTKTGKIIVCATPRTLASPRYAALKTKYARDIEVFEPDCSDWTQLIESDQMSDNRIRQAVEPGLQAGADQIILGCTHYHWIQQEIQQLAADKAIVIQPEEALIRQLSQVLARLA